MPTYRTTCKVGACEPFCGLEVEVEGGKMLRVRPDPDHPITKGYACIKGMHVQEYQNDPDRLLHPQRRGSAGWERLSWEQATAEIGQKLRAIRAQHGPTSIATYWGNAADSLSITLTNAFCQGFGSPNSFNVLSLEYTDRGAVALVVGGVQGRLFSSDNALPAGWVNLMGLGQIGIGLAMAYGGMTRLAALGLAVTWLLGVALLGLEPMLENSFILGLAAFFWLAGRRSEPLDWLIFPSLEPSIRLMAWAVPALRVGLGLSLVVTAFTGKLINPNLVEAFLKQHALNFLPALGLPISDAVFAVLAGSVELLVGLWLVVGLFPREVVLLAWVPFNLTLTVFNWVELAGHLPFYSGMALLLIWERGETTSRSGFTVCGWAAGRKPEKTGPAQPDPV